MLQLFEDLGGVLRLNMGVNAADMGDLYKDTVTDSYSIKHLSGVAGNEEVQVQSLGVTSRFSGVSKILVNNGDKGHDFIYIAPGVLADVEIGRIIVDRGGIRETIALPEKSSAAVPATLPVQ